MKDINDRFFAVSSSPASTLSTTPVLTSAASLRGYRVRDAGAHRFGQVTAATGGAVTDRVSHAYGQLPLSFEVNRGQADPQVDFVARGPDYTVFLSAREAVFALSQQQREERDSSNVKALGRPTSLAPTLAQAFGEGSASTPPQSRDEKRRSAVLRMKLVDANDDAKVVGVDALPGKVNYILGNDPARWRTGIPTYAKATYRQVYPGIDVVYYGNQRQLEYDIVVAPGADPGLVTLAFEGPRDVYVDARGELVLDVDGGTVRQHKPVVYQEVAGVKQQVTGRYVLKGHQQLGFEVGAYDPTRPLIIDPVVAYSTYLGGSSADEGRAIAVDGAGNAYVTGYTSSIDFPTTSGSAQTTAAGYDAFVTKLDATGSARLYSTYLGGSGADFAFGVAVDGADSAYVTGQTTSTNFPTTTGSAQPTFAGSADAFVTRLDATGSLLVYSTYLGGSSSDAGYGIAVDDNGSACVTGVTTGNFPTTLGSAQTTYAGFHDAFVTKLNATGSVRLYSTYLGGADYDVPHAIAVDDAGSAYITGQTYSIDFPTTSGSAQMAKAGGTDTFVTKLDATGSVRLYSTYLGGSGSDVAWGIAVDGGGNAYVTGNTGSTNFPTTSGSAQPTFGGYYDAFVTKLNAIGSALVYSTYLGGSDDDSGYDIAVDGAGNAYVTGYTFSTNFPTTSGSAQTTFGGGLWDASVTKLDATGSAHLYSTYLGGSGSDTAFSIAVDHAGSAYITGYTRSNDFPTTSGAVQTTKSGSSDAFITKIEFLGPPATLSLSPAVATNPVTTQHCVTATVQDAFGNPTPDITVRFSITGAMTTSGWARTDGGGHATFCYVGPTTPGADAITAYADTNDNATQDIGEPFGAATQTWFLPLPTATDQCKNDGWQAFGVFMNQGDCVSLVSSKGKNSPSKLP